MRQNAEGHSDTCVHSYSAVLTVETEIPKTGKLAVYARWRIITIITIRYLDCSARDGPGPTRVHPARGISLQMSL